jgi:hypothetical protein
MIREMNKKSYFKPQTETIDFVSSESVMYGIGDGSTGDQFGKETINIDMNEDENEMKISVWDD